MKLAIAYCLLAEMLLTSCGEKDLKKDEFKYFSVKFADPNLPPQSSWICRVKPKT